MLVRKNTESIDLPVSLDFPRNVLRVHPNNSTRHISSDDAFCETRKMLGDAAKCARNTSKHHNTQLELGQTLRTFYYITVKCLSIYLFVGLGSFEYFAI